MIEIYICMIFSAPGRTTTKTPSVISKPVANVKATVNSSHGGGDNSVKIAELTQQVHISSPHPQDSHHIYLNDLRKILLFQT